jgi:two-component system, OmpR family, sensor kinase
MSDPVWYRSLYWRIALGFVALLATLLAVQGVVFLWMTGRMDALFPGRSPAQLAETIATDVATAVTEQPALDLQSHVMSRYGRALRGFAVVMTDGRTIVSERIPPPPNLAGSLRGRLRGPGGPGLAPPPWERDGNRRGGRGRGGSPGGSGGPPPPAEISTIVANGVVVGAVGVPGGPPPWQFAIREIGPMLAGVALALLIAGSAVGALLVVRPVHRRLRGLQQAAASLGAGDSAARAPESGGDEVASLARAFNEMAGRLEERTRALEVADRTRRQLLADVSHELSTPLAAIRGYVETLDMADARLDAASKRRYLQIVTEETARLEHIVGDLLDLARLEGGGVAFSDDEVSVPALMNRLRDRHARTLAEKRIALDTGVAPGVSTIRGDGNRLEQALQNLVANALRHTPEGGRVAVTVDEVDDAVRFTVDDTGPGIPPEHLPRIFDRFYKVDASRAGTVVPSGSGLGLSIVQAIVARHGGAVTAANRPEGGARFEIRLPLRRGA